MTKRMIVVAVVATALFGLTLLAAGPFSGSWSNEVLIEVGANLFKSFDSVLHLDYSFGGLVATSESEMYLAGGFVWQGFGMSGQLGAFDLQTDVLFGPSTSDFIYSQAIVTMSLAGGRSWLLLRPALGRGAGRSGEWRCVPARRERGSDRCRERD